MKVPRWLKIHEEIDYLDYNLRVLLWNDYQKNIKLSVIEKMVDESTGVRHITFQQAEKMMKRIIRLKKELNKLK